MKGHSVVWTIEPDYVRAKFSCDNPDGAKCRTTCQGRCEWWSTDDDVNCTGCGTALVSGECQVLLFLSDDGPPEEIYDGTKVPLRDGPIEVMWNGDGYLWRYA